jgi:iron(III) transport system ATP-binding protein
MEALVIADVVKRHGSNTILNSVSLALEPGKIVSILGPSGCGKTTLLRCVAGLEELTSGSILIDGQCVAGPGVWIPPERRNIGLVFQSYALWPHLTVFDNIALGLRIRKTAKAAIAERVEAVLSKLELDGLARRYPAQLSGGQQQRVAVGRAIVLEPKILLFDEPLSNLDARIRERVRGELHDLLRKLSITTVYVTHDKAEAMAISDRIVVMRGGNIEQIGTGREIYEQPSTAFVADFISRCNLISVRAHRSDDAEAPLSVGGQALAFARDGEDASGLLGFRPEDVIINSELDRPNTVTARLVKQTYFGHAVEVIAAIGGSEVVLSSSLPVSGESLRITLIPERLQLFTGEAESRI